MGNATFRAATSGGDNTFGTAANNTTAPTTVAGDMELAWITAASLAPAAAPTYTTPSGWTLLGSSSQFPLVGGALNIRVWLFGKKATGAGASQTFTASANCALGYVRESYSGVDPNGFFGQVTFGNGGPGTTATLSALTTARVNALINAFISQGAAQTITPPGSMTERLDNGTYGASSADAIQAAIGSTGTKVFTLPASTDFVWGFAEFNSNNTVTNVESITFSDSQTGVAKFAGPVGETISLSDSQATAAHFIGASLESIAFADAVDGVFRQFGDMAETLSLSDSQDAVLVSGSIAQETISFSDSINGVLLGLGVVGETMLFSDSVAGAFKGVDSVAESIAFSDSQIGVFDATGLVGESITLSDGLGASAAFIGLQIEGITFVDAQEAITPGEALIFEQITLQDVQSANSATSAEVVESIAFLDLVQVAGDVPVMSGGMGFELIDHPSSMWWKRKPKSLPAAAAEKKVKQIAKAIDEIAAEKIEQDEPIRQRDVRDEIAPLLAEMPGFDWRPLFRAVVEYRQQEAARLEAVAQIERIRAIERDDDDVLALLMSF